MLWISKTGAYETERTLLLTPKEWELEHVFHLYTGHQEPDEISYV